MLDDKTLTCSIREIKSNPAPPQDVKTVVGVQYLLLGLSVDESKDYHLIRTMMSQGGQKSPVSMMVNLDPGKIPPQKVQIARDLLKNLSYERVQKVSKAASTIYLWCVQTVERAESGGGAKEAA